MLINELYGLDESVSDAVSLIDILQQRAKLHPNRIVYTFLDFGELPPRSLTYSDLNREAKQLAVHLQHIGMQGHQALLLYPPGLDYIIAFFACLYAGVIAVPAYPPSNNRHMPRLHAILKDSQAEIILTTKHVSNSIRQFASATEELLAKRWLQTDVMEHVDISSWQSPVLQPTALAFLQYTSGSTGDAKGVMISHGNLMANQQLIKNRFSHDEHSTVVGWLPLYHDMGLIGNVMQPLYCGASAVLMSPMAFLEKPRRWLQAISDYQAHTSGGPNFAFDLCVQKISRDELDKIDLSSWQLAFNGAETINPQTLQRFSQTFARCGFQERAFYPCYGLAESTLLATGIDKHASPRIAAFDKTDLEQRIVNSVDDCDPNARHFVGCGAIDAEAGQGLRIVDSDSGMNCDDGRIGEIWLSGSSVAQGYWQNPEVSNKTFVVESDGQRWLRTGDLGFVNEGELFVSGRLKDLIIVRGRNYFPHDLERAVESASNALNPTSTVAFAINEDNSEKLIVLAELKRNRVRQGDFRTEFAAIRARLVEECSIQADSIYLLKPGAILKTSSGKLRRSACKELFLQQGFEFVAMDSPQVSNVIPLPKGAGEKLSQTLSSMNEADAADLLAEHLALKAAELSGLAADTVNPNHALTSLGVDSIKAVEMKYFIDELLCIDMPIADLLGSTTLFGCAVTALKLKNVSDVSTAFYDIAGVNTAMSYNQQALWTRTKIETGDVLYHMPVALLIQGDLDCNALQLALVALYRRHSQLRSGFDLDAENRPVCLPLDSIEPWLECTTCSDDTERLVKLQTFVNKPFDLPRESLLRCGVFSRGDADSILVFCAHHLIVDFRSLQILLSDLQTYYLAQKNGQIAEFSSSSASYADFVIWQQNYLTSSTADRDREYWHQQLAGELPRLELPSENTQIGSLSYRSEAEILSLAPETLNELKYLAVINHTTLYTLLLSIFKTLLYRYSGQSDLIVGTPILGRPKREFADVVGYFVNPVALRTHPHSEQCFCDYLAHVNTVVLEALAHQHYPYTLLTEQVLSRASGDLAPFRTWFVLQTGENPFAAALALGQSGTSGQWAGFTAESMVFTESTEEFDLTLQCAETGQGLTAVFRYRREVLSRETVQRMLGHFQCLLHDILENPNLRLSQLSLLTAAEQEQLAILNTTVTAYPEQQSIVDVFEAVVEHNPQATALIFDELQFSYAALNAQANRLAYYLLEKGAKPEQRIALSMPRGASLLIGLLAILKTGAVYVPVDPTYPEERQRYLFQDAGADWLLTVSSLASKLDNTHRVKICVDDAEVYSAYSSENPKVVRSLESAAYVIYTSGSTGQPKGVVVSHANLLHSTRARNTYYRDCVECYLLLPSFAFDSSIAGIFWSLSQGACLCLPNDGLLKEPLGLGTLIERNHVTHLLTLPSLYQLLLEHVPNAALQSLRTVIVAGESCLSTLTKLHFSQMPVTKLFNEYGPTEATVWCSVYQMQASDNDMPPIGKAIANMRLHIVDAALQPVPIGVAGELLVGGNGISRGYLGQPALTAERFVPDSFANDGGRLYRTGDRARYRADGNIEFLGRLDQQVKIRGFRIELGEIEACLLRHPAVNVAAVIVREDVPNMKRLVAYLTGDASSLEDLKSQLKVSLPDYMQPSAWVWLETMPLNANGKLNRKALPLPEIQSEHQDGFVAPRDEAEEAVASIWQEILGVERIGIHDDFFELGGHSLAVVQVMAKIQELFAIDLPVDVLFEATTLAEFVDCMVAYQD